MLVLLIIFMITAPILQSGIEVDLPKTQTVKEISEPRLVVTIDRAQLIYLGDDAVNIHELGDKVHAQMHNPQSRRGLSALRRDRALRHLRHGDRHVAPIRHRKYQRRDRAAERRARGRNDAMTAVRIHIDDREPEEAAAVVRACFTRLLFGSLAVSTLFPIAAICWGRAGRRRRGVRETGRRRCQGVPLPRPEAVTPSRVVDTTKGLYKSEPQPKPKAPPPDAKQIPEFTKEKQPHYVTRPSKMLEDNTPPPQNAVPYGQGGSPAVPYSQFAHGQRAAPPTAGMGFSGPAAAAISAAAFPGTWTRCATASAATGCKAPWTRRVRWAPRAVVTFRHSAERRGRQRSNSAIERQRLGG